MTRFSAHKASARFLGSSGACSVDLLPVLPLSLEGLELVSCNRGKGLADGQCCRLQQGQRTDVPSSDGQCLLEFSGEAFEVALSPILVTQLCTGCRGIELGSPVFDLVQTRTFRSTSELTKFLIGCLLVVNGTEVGLEGFFELLKG